MSHNELGYADRIREQGYRLTPQRQIIMDTLCEMGGHAAVGDIYERVNAQVPTIDRATVYRTIRFFQDLRLIVSTEMDGVVLYEVARLTPHHHLVCRHCGQVQGLSNAHLNDLVAHLQNEHDFRAEIDHLTLHGVCAACQTLEKDV